MQPKKLEQYKYFQPFAWTLCISFAAFVGLLALELKANVLQMQETALSFEARLERVEQAVGVNPAQPGATNPQ